MNLLRVDDVPFPKHPEPKPFEQQNDNEASEQQTSLGNQLIWDQLLQNNAGTIKAIIRYQLKLSSHHNCSIGDVEEWLRGSFNISIPVYIDSWDRCRVLIRFPIPHKLGEHYHPGNSDEKVRSEAATYRWMNLHCPEIPIPRVYGFGTTSNYHFRFKPRSEQMDTNITLSMKSEAMGVGYLVMDYVEKEQGQELSSVWNDHNSDPFKKDNLIRDLCRIMLRLRSYPMSRIASLTISDHGHQSLTNRPLSPVICEAENVSCESCPPIMGRCTTYNSSVAYVADLLAYHGTRLRHQSNGFHPRDPRRGNICEVTFMRACTANFLVSSTTHGPFYMDLTDLHPSNIFVDDDWHITALIGLEWACFRPAEMLRPPMWLTGQPINGLVGAKLEEFGCAAGNFVNIMQQEEHRQMSGLALPYSMASLSNFLLSNCATGRVWFFLALNSYHGLPAILRDHVRPMFPDATFLAEPPHLWQPATSVFFKSMLKVRMEHDRRRKTPLKKADHQDNEQNDGTLPR